MEALQTFKLAAVHCGTNSGFLPNLWKGVNCPNGTPTIASVQDVFLIVGNIVQILIAAAGAIAVIVIVVAGIFYITSAGDPGRIKTAKDILVNAVVGLVIIIIAYAVVTFIASGFNS